MATKSVADVEQLEDQAVEISVGDDKTVKAVVVRAKDSKAALAVILTHGAGGDLDGEQITLLSHEIAKQGLCCVRFTYKAPQIKKRTEVYTKVVQWLLDQKEYGVQRVIVGGRSMGARVVLELASDKSLSEIAGGICLSYPLQKERGSSELRNTAFPNVLSPVLFASGTEDPQCQREVMKKAIKTIPSKVEMIWVQGANHSGMPKSSKKDVFEIPDYFHSIVAWVCELAKEPFKPELATNNSPERPPVAAMIAKRRRDEGDDPEAKRQFDLAESVLCRKPR